MQPLRIVQENMQLCLGLRKFRLFMVPLSELKPAIVHLQKLSLVITELKNRFIT